jgi:hypothetical protein
LTGSQKIALERLSSDWGVNMAVVGRRLIQYLLSGKLTLQELLRRYQAEVKSCGLKSKPAETRTSKLGIRVSEDEKRKLSVLADQHFYLPGEAARILVELFIMGVIEKSDIWN